MEDEVITTGAHVVGTGGLGNGFGLVLGFSGFSGRGSFGKTFFGLLPVRNGVFSVISLLGDGSSKEAALSKFPTISLTLLRRGGTGGPVFDDPFGEPYVKDEDVISSAASKLRCRKVLTVTASTPFGIGGNFLRDPFFSDMDPALLEESCDIL